MKKIKLDEVCNLVGMTRRIIQEYEDAGLAIKPTDVNKYGHLLYGETEIERLWTIRFYRELGYKKNDIKNIFNKADYSRSEELEIQIQKMEKKRDDLDNLIALARKMKSLGVGLTAFFLPEFEYDEISFNDYTPLLASGFKNEFEMKFVDDSDEHWLSKEEEEVCEDIIKKIFGLADNEYQPASDLVQSEIKKLHKCFGGLVSDSILIVSSISMVIAPGSDVSIEIDRKYGAGKGKYFYDAIQAYCAMNYDKNESDKLFYEALENLEKLQNKGYEIDSKESINEVVKIHNFFSEVKCLNEETHIRMVEQLGELFGSQEYKKIIDNGAEKGFTWYISNAIKHYCEEIRRRVE